MIAILKFKLTIFSLMIDTFGVVQVTHVPNKSLCISSPIFHSGVFIVLHFLFGSVFLFESNFVWSVRSLYSFIYFIYLFFLHIEVQFKKIFSIELPLCQYQWSVACNIESFWGSLFCSINQCVYSFANIVLSWLRCL